jgi:hypothetical protein
MRYVIAVCLLTATAAVGCGAKSELEGVVPAAGTVTYQGQPIEGAAVIFSPEAGGTAAAGRTDASGRFQLTTLTANDGALPGKYQVGISKIEGGGSTVTAEEAAKSMTFAHGPAPAAPVKDLLPEKYKLGKSEQTAEVTVGGANEFSFDLTD